MRRFAFLFAACSLVACTSTPAPIVVRGHTVIDGSATIDPVTVAGIPVTPAYKVNGHAEVWIQSEHRPYLTVLGDITTVVSELPGIGKPSADLAPGDVLISVPHPATQIRTFGRIPAAPADGTPVRIYNDEAVAASKAGTAGDCAPALKVAPPPAPSGPSTQCQPTALPSINLAKEACGLPIYQGPCGQEPGQCTVPTSSHPKMGLKEGEVGVSPFSDCGVPKAGLGEACPQGIPAIVKGIADLFTGRWF